MVIFHSFFYVYPLKMVVSPFSSAARWIFRCNRALGGGVGIFFAITGEVSEPGVSAVGKSVGKSLGKTHHVDHHVDDLGWFLYVFYTMFF